MIEVRVPATSANLGVGYDCLGMALDLYGTFRFDCHALRDAITGCSPAFQNKDNLVYRSFCYALDAWRIKAPCVHIHIDTPIPPARGLGSSAACIVAGILGAQAYSGMTRTREELARLANALEGHPDNVMPALYGGLCASFCEGDKPYTACYDVSEQLRFITLIPDHEVHTDEARRLLPDSLSYGDAVYQMGRCSALCKAFETGDLDLLAHACQDRMQEPYRQQLIPHFAKVKRFCLEQGAAAFFISGSGSTMIAVCEKQTAKRLYQNIRPLYPNWQIQIRQAAAQGGVITRHG